METVTIRRAKADLSRLIARACRGEEIVIARGKKSVVRLVALRDEKGNRKPGALKGKLFCPPDVFAPLTDQELKDMGFEQ
ncbi:MAG: type II toxin-antitoxin system Phd/YefM family antitoxin [Terriglobales bacterium]|jgi:antitoxin (DNA-binding transcriptional repressor) of toxin-antitoxin stability system